MIDIDHPAVQVGVDALFGHHPERGGVEREGAVFAVLHAVAEAGHRLAFFSDDEIIVLDAALSSDEGNWHDDKKEGIRKVLLRETSAEVERRNLIPDDQPTGR